MAEPAHPDIQSILAALASQRPPSSTSTQTPPAATGAYPAPPGTAQPAAYQPPPPGVPGVASFAPGSALPAPASSGNVDLSALRPVNSGTMNFEDINDAIYVPSDAVGMIIGKGGETIREMQNSTGCKINVAQSSGPGEVQREIALIGSRDSIARAKQAIDEKVEAVRQKSGGAPGGGRGRGPHDDRPSYSHQGPDPSTNQPQASAGDGQDPYAQYGGYQNYVALWYQSLMYQQQQQGAQGAPTSQNPTGGAPPPGGQ
ncbi:hypothetical protein M440DRAFT_1393284 [Trichoderma longibrachiatum ATCC 18648]|uniref:K Homology domain-containing protein n=1 Tax=Trichoderma longibrachiatum ATCC 18648 TaxID=983965 RepID=A0A2T4BXU6_TRILO|nr:hypothetical protein M440DRAFT_1393284 [Trichoderma longibrachiatum ATCC 18648]